MSAYTPHTPEEIRDMLAVIGVASLDDLVAQVPEALRARARIALPGGCSEPELRARFATRAAQNRAADALSFLGAGAYAHHIPAVVDQILRRAEFATAYTPYQAEVSQGTLQAIFEFQTFTAMLLGLDVANASMYDGASATAEAVLMAHRLEPTRRVVALARTLLPQYREVVVTYLRGAADLEVREVPFAADGRLDLARLQHELTSDLLCVVVGQPNAFGILEDLGTISARAHGVGALVISATPEALALAAIRSPGASGVDIAVAEGQSFGLPLSYGGPGVGLFATHERFVRSMPGRLVGETVDARGRRGYVLTLATREQHIRRERATSNICTNHGLAALAATVYLAILGRRGLRALARVNYRAAHATARRLAECGAPQVFAGPFFNEFVVRAPRMVEHWEAVAGEGLIAGFPLGGWYPELAECLLVCVTEVHGPGDVERLADAIAAREGPSQRNGVGG